VFSDLEWITRPSRDAIMSFTIPVEIRELPVNPGDRVKKGDVLIRARDGDAVAALETQRVRAGNTGPLDSARASVDSAKTRYDRIKEADKERATNQQEVDDRRVQLDAAKAQLLNATNDLKEEAAKVKQLEESLARYRLEAPFDGTVESIIVEAGSSIEPPNPVLRIVNIDALWIDLPAPTELTLGRGLKSGDPAWVMLDVPGAAVAQGKVLYVSPVADAAASTRRVRIELPNPKQYPPGTRARVRFDRPEGFAPVADASVRRGVVPHAGVATAEHDAANCPVCAKAAWEAIKKDEDPAAAVQRKASGRSGPGVTK
jgi:RND family efflux transporter MFP subunit